MTATPSATVRLVLLCLALGAALPAAGRDPAGDRATTAVRPPVDSAADPGAGQEGEREQDESAGGTVWSERIVVTATRSDRAAADLPFHAFVMNERELENAPEYGVIDLLRRVPGINLQGDDSVLTAGTIDGGIAFRGLGGTARGRALVLVDGMPVNDPFGTFVLWTRIPRDALERVEVLPGGTSIWGNLSLSGVVSLITRAPQDRRYGARGRVGNRSTHEGTFSYSDLGDRWSGWLSGSYLDSDGHHLLRENDRGAADTATAKDFGTLTGKLSRSLSPHADLHLGLTLFDEDARAGSLLSRRYYYERALTATFNRMRESGGGWELRAYGRDTESDESDPSLARDRATEIPDSRTRVPAESLGLGGIWRSRGSGEHALAAGLDLQRVSIDAVEDGGYASGAYTTRAFIQGEQQLAGLFLQDVFTPSPRTTFTLGGRLDAIRTRDGRRRDVELATDDSSERVLVDQSTDTTFNPSLGFVHAASRRARLRGAVYSGFRAGAPAELFVDNLGRSVTLSNPTVSPERLIGAEAGLDLTVSRRAATRATLFWSEVSDLIDRLLVGRAGPGGEVIEPCGFLSAGATCRIRANLGEVRSTGIELEQDVRFTERWRAHLTGSLVNAEVRSSPGNPELIGNRVQRVPEAAAVVSLLYDNPAVIHAELRGRYVGDRFNDAENVQPMPSQLTVDLSAARSLGPRWRVHAGVTNLFDREHVAGYDGSLVELGPPRLVHLGFSFSSR